MHLDEERVQRLLHGELEPAGQRLAKQHLVACADCRALVEVARAEEQEVFGRFRAVDHPLPDVDPGVILAAGPRGGGRWQRWAAGILLVAAAGGAAYAAPGSPLPRVLTRLVAVLAPTQSQPVADTTAAEPAAPGAGIAVAPGDHLTIRFVTEPGAYGTVSLTDGDEVVVRAVEGAATFSSDVERLSIRSTGPARFEILIPRSAPSVEILAGDAPVFHKRAAEVATEARPGADGRYSLTLSRHAP